MGGVPTLDFDAGTIHLYRITSIQRCAGLALAASCNNGGK